MGNIAEKKRWDNKTKKTRPMYSNDMSRTIIKSTNQTINTPKGNEMRIRGQTNEDYIVYEMKNEKKM